MSGEKNYETCSKTEHALIEAVQSEQASMIADLRSIVAIKSVKGPKSEKMPFGPGPYRVLEHALRMADNMGFITRNLDGYCGYAEYGQGDEYVAVPVHLDVVPEGDGWQHPPYGAVLEAGKIYGRGASDNKGPAVSALYSLRALQSLNIQTKKRARVIFGTDEETGMACMDHYLAHEPLPDCGFSPDAGYPAYNREKGIVSVWLHHAHHQTCAESSILCMEAGQAFNVVPDCCTVTFKESPGFDLPSIERAKLGNVGKIYEKAGSGGRTVLAVGDPAHGASPQNGVNAIGHMIHFLERNLPSFRACSGLQFLAEVIGRETDGASLGIAANDGLSGALTNNLAIVSLDASSLSIGLNIRYPVLCDGEKILSNLSEKAKEYGFVMRVDSHSPPLFVPEDDPLIIKLGSAYQCIKGQSMAPKAMGGGTYARKFQNKVVAFGGTGHDGHRANEHVVIDEWMEHTKICTLALYKLVCEP